MDTKPDGTEARTWVESDQNRPSSFEFSIVANVGNRDCNGKWVCEICEADIMYGKCLSCSVILNYVCDRPSR